MAKDKKKTSKINSFDPNSFCIDDVFKYIEKKGKGFKESLVKDSKKKKKKPRSVEEEVMLARAKELKAKTYQTDYIVEINV
jgi:hypothetical protein